MSDLFYVFGIALTVSALVLSFVGLRAHGFPKSRGLLTGVLTLMIGLVAASCAFAVVLSREEADHREEEIAEFEAEQQEEADEGEAPSEPGQPEELEPPVEQQPAGGPALELTSPEDGSLVFEPSTLDAPAGEVTIEYTNPSDIQHNVAIEGDGAVLAQGETVTGGDTGPATASLEPGEYVFFCSIPGHREAGMEGQLTVE
jgi:plastocyanin